MGLIFAKTKKVLRAERSKPHMCRWRVSYCRRRGDQIKGGLPTRPRIWMDAIFVNKWSTAGRSWITRDTASGDEVQDANKGGRGERFALLHAFSDYVEDDGSHRVTFAPRLLRVASRSCGRYLVLFPMVRKSAFGWPFVSRMCRIRRSPR